MTNFLRYIFNWSQLPIINKRSDICRKFHILIDYGICDYYEETLNSIKESEFIENSLFIAFIVIFFTFILWIFYDYLHNEQTDAMMLNNIDEKIVETNNTNMQLIDRFLLIKKSEENNLKIDSNNADNNGYKIDNHLKLDRFNEVFTDDLSTEATPSTASNLFSATVTVVNGSAEDIQHEHYENEDSTPTTVLSTNTEYDSEASCLTNPPNINISINSAKSSRSDDESNEKLMNDAKFINNIFNVNKKKNDKSNSEDLELCQKSNVQLDKLKKKNSDINEEFVKNIFYEKKDDFCNINNNNNNINNNELLTTNDIKINKECFDESSSASVTRKISPTIANSKDLSTSNSSVTSSATTPRISKSPHMKRLLERQRLNQLKETDSVVTPVQMSGRKTRGINDVRLQVHGDPRRDLPTKPISTNASDIKRGIFEKRRLTTTEKSHKELKIPQPPPPPPPPLPVATVNTHPLTNLQSGIKKVTKFIEKKSPNLNNISEYELETSVLVLPGTSILNKEISNTINNLKSATIADPTNLKLNQNLLSNVANIATSSPNANANIIKQQQTLEQQIHNIYDNAVSNIMPSGLDLSSKGNENIFEEFFYK